MPRGKISVFTTFWQGCCILVENKTLKIFLKTVKDRAILREILDPQGSTGDSFLAKLVTYDRCVVVADGSYYDQK